MDNLPRPPRSLRNRNSSLNHKEIINQQKEDISRINSSSNYLEEIESQKEEMEQKIIENEKDEPILENKKEKPKVTVLNVRKNTTKELKDNLEKEKKQNQELSKSIKKELQKVEEVVEEAKEEIEKVKQKTFQKINQLTQKVFNFAIKSSERIIDKSKEILMSIIFKKKKTKKKLIKYSDLVKKNIQFLDYQNNLLVKGINVNSSDFEKIFLSNVKKDVKYCEKFVRNIKPNSNGIYANRNLSEIFKNINDKDIYLFIEYVYNNPESFIGNTHKFSEAFATWIVKKSHEV
jgi:hypothetical protein